MSFASALGCWQLIPLYCPLCLCLDVARLRIVLCLPSHCLSDRVVVGSARYRFALRFNPEIYHSQPQWATRPAPSARKRAAAALADNLRGFCLLGCSISHSPSSFTIFKQRARKTTATQPISCAWLPALLSFLFSSPFLLRGSFLLRVCGSFLFFFLASIGGMDRVARSNDNQNRAGYATAHLPCLWHRPGMS